MNKLKVLSMLGLMLLTSCGSKVSHQVGGEANVAINPKPMHIYHGIDPETIEFIERLCVESKKTSEEADKCIEKLLGSLTSTIGQGN